MGALRTPVPRDASRPDFAVDESAFELAEVPAAVVCATCGLPECSCSVDRPSTLSGVVAIVPWERPGGLVARLWATAKLATLSPGEFFGALPPGGNAAPLGFALLAELLASFGLAATFSALALLVVPTLASELLAEPALRATFVRAITAGVPILALGMVLLHAGHGLSLDAAARRQGSRRSGRGLRFGLYGCGWDLLTLPLGLLVLSLTDGPLTALRYSARGMTAPNAAALGYLRHVHELEAEAAILVSRRAAILVFVPTLALIVVAFGVGLSRLAH